MWTHIDARSGRVKLFSWNGGLDVNVRFDRKGRKQVRLLEFPLHPCPPGKKKRRKESIKTHSDRIGLRLSEYSLASSNHFSGGVFDADLGKWDSLLFHL